MYIDAPVGVQGAIATHVKWGKAGGFLGMYGYLEEFAFDLTKGTSTGAFLFLEQIAT